MQRLKKIIIILSLSLFLTATLTPKHEKKADAFVITGTMALGTLAVLAAGGVISYHNRDLISNMGERIYSGLSGTDTNISDMVNNNKYGISDRVAEQIAKTTEEAQTVYLGQTINIGEFALHSSSETFFDVPIGWYDLIQDGSIINVEIHHNAIEGSRGLSMRYAHGSRGVSRSFNNMNTEYPTLIYDTIGPLTINEDNIDTDIFKNLDSIRISSSWGTDYQEGYVTISVDNTGVTRFNDEVQNWATYEDLAQHVEAIQALYGSQDVSIDYDRLEDIMTNENSTPVSLDSITSLVSGLESSIEDGFDNQTSILNNIFNGVKNIPSIMASNATAVLGGISSLGENILDGLSTGLDNLSKANEQLWEDAGVVWSGISDNINAMGQTIADALSPALTAMNDRLFDFTGVLADLPNTIRTGVTDGISSVGEKLNDLSATVKEIPGAVSTSITDTWSSAFAIPDNYFIDRTSAIMEIINPKLPQFPTKEALFPSDFDEKGDWAGISADFSHYGIGEQMVIDNEAPNYYRRQIKLWISGILYFFTALFIIKKTAGVIRT